MEKYKTFVLQNRAELDKFTEFVRASGFRSYLEIGSKFGGSLWRIAQAMPFGSRVVSIDLPWADGSFKDSEPWLRKCIADLRNVGFDAHLRIGDSHDADSIAFARKLGPYDLVMLDGDHSAAGVRADWLDYGKLGKVVCFHDIVWEPRETKKHPIEVPAFWNELKKNYRHLEIRLEDKDNGIGILWRMS